jgi:hypothetical protein
MILDLAPVLVLWFFDSRGEYGSWFFEHGSIIFIGGVSPKPNSQPLPDWVDSTVGDWIQTELKAMEAAWGPQESWAAIAFVHIPPSVTHLFDILGSLMSLALPYPSLLTSRHAIQVLQSNLDPTKNPGLNGVYRQYSKVSFLIMHLLKFSNQ